MKPTKRDIEELLARGVCEVIDKESLQRELLAGKKLRIKLGIDPTSPHLHLGRAVSLLKLRDFQSLGHQIIFIVGDFTGEIGDTSDKESERPMLSTEQVRKNMKTYLDQAAKVLDMKSVEIRYNSEWLETTGYREICRQANVFALAEFINRDNIKKRLREGKHISLREVMYPLMQGYDSVVVKADVEIGGTDQRFNMLAGRELQRSYSQKPQSIIMVNLILGTDGRKMSSSWGNTINLTDGPDEMLGKVMTIPDSLIVNYLIHCTRTPMSEIKKIELSLAKGLNPRDAKMRLAHKIVALYYGRSAADQAEHKFVSTFQKHETPRDLPELVLRHGLSIIDVLLAAGFAGSKGEARRLIKQGGVSLDGEIIRDDSLVPNIPDGGAVLQKGKRNFVKILRK
ncbi:tyrosine--tRNA ligase [Candidatus Uhrbacteria bacterium]|nr:tyrosine--tRNA ligase [Candidatus Uhrbacteria bacterium]